MHPDGPGRIWIELGMLFGASLLSPGSPQVMCCPGQQYDLLQYPLGWSTNWTARQVGFLYRGYSQGSPAGLQITQEELDLSLQPNLVRIPARTALLHDVVVYPGNVTYQWPHSVGGFGVNASFADGHAEFVNLLAEDYRRSLDAAAAGVIFSDTFAALFWVGLDNRDFSRLRTWLP